MACCCKSDKTDKMAVSCLGRCDLPKHKCLDREDIRPGPVPHSMGWLYTARDSPEHQLRCGWRPGHISCSVLRKIERHNCMKCGECSPCQPVCSKPPCYKPCCAPSPRCVSLCSPNPPCSGAPCTQPLIRIVRHGGQYTITTKPSNISNHPSGPYPLKYVLNTDEENDNTPDARFSVEAKFNDYHFDYTSSTSSFVLDFSPPEQKCYKPCPKRSFACFSCQSEMYGTIPGDLKASGAGSPPSKAKPPPKAQPPPPPRPAQPPPKPSAPPSQTSPPSSARPPQAGPPPGGPPRK